MTTLSSLQTEVSDIKNELFLLQSSIGESYDQMIRGEGPRASSVSMQKEITMLADESERFDRLFEEEEAKRQAFGGRSRKQTLQEFVLLLFYTSFALFSISLASLAARNGGSSAAAKIVGIMLFIGLIVTGILIRYA